MEAQLLATNIVQKLARNGYKAYFAGGWVRDFVLKHPSSDIDIATDAPPQAILDLFPHTILVGLAFGVIIVVMQGHQFEVTTFRKDIDYSSGRKPSAIEMSTAEEDASRRDFTINGMFYDPIENEIYDFVGGMADLQNKVIRTIGNPDARFVEDRLRMIRAVRFACRFGFHIDSETEEAIIGNADTLFPPVAMERVWQEFNKMACAPNFDHALVELHRLALLPEIFPQLKHVHLNDIKQRVSKFHLFPENTPTALTLWCLFPNTPLDDLLEIFRFLRTSLRDASYIKLIVLCKQLVDREQDTSAKEWVYFYADKDSELILAVDAAMRRDREALLQRHADRKKIYFPHIQRVATKKPLVTAAHLQKAGIVAGREMGLLLKEAESIAILRDLHQPEIVLAQLQSSSLWQKDKELRCTEQ